MGFEKPLSPSCPIARSIWRIGRASSSVKIKMRISVPGTRAATCQAEMRCALRAVSCNADSLVSTCVVKTFVNRVTLWRSGANRAIAASSAASSALGSDNAVMMLRASVLNDDVLGSYITLWTTLKGRSVIRPVAAAAGSVAACELKYECVVQPRSHVPQKWQARRPPWSSVRTAQRPIVRSRSPP